MRFDKAEAEYYLGIDLHKRQAVCCLLDGKGEERGRERVESSREGLRSLLAGLSGYEVGVAIEASGCTAWAVDLLRELGVRVEVANPYDVSLIRRDRNKTDRRDAKHLAKLLRLGELPRAHIPEPAVRGERKWLRHRAGVAVWRGMVRNKIHAIVTANGYGYAPASPFTQKGRAWLRGLELGEDERSVLEDLLVMEEELGRRLAVMDKKVRERYRGDERVELLRTMPGVGYFLGALILAEIDGPERFGDFHELVSYSGLAPGGHQSGEVEQSRPITREGSPWLRWGLVEAAQTVKWRRQGALYGWYRGVEKRRGPKKATVALAHKMLKIMHSMLKQGRAFDYRPETHRSHGRQGSEV
jgi:transposase